MGDLFWVQDLNTAEPKSKREQELQLARARSHAALVGHLRAKKKRKENVQTGLTAGDVATGLGIEDLLPCSEDGWALSRSLNASAHESSARTPLCNSIVPDVYTFGWTTPNDAGDVEDPENAVSHTRAGLFRMLESPYPGFGNYRNELFSYAPHGNNDVVRRTIDFCWHTGSSNNDFACQLFDVTNFFSCCLTSMNNELIYHAAIAAFGALSDRATNATFFNRDLFQHQASAIGRVRSHLDQKDAIHSQGLISAIYYLGVFEALTGNAPAAAQHCQAITQIIKARGGLGALPEASAEKSMILDADAQNSIVTGRCIYEGHRRPFTASYPAVSTSFTPLRRARSFPTGFQPLIASGTLSLDCVGLLSQAVETGLGDNSPAAQELRVKRRWRFGKHHDIIEACPILHTPDRDSMILEKLICWALYLCCWLDDDDRIKLRSTMTLYRYARNYVTSRIVLFAAQHPPERVPWDAYIWDCILWLLVIVVDSWRSGQSEETILPEGRELYAAMFRLRPSSIGDWTEVEKSLSKFFASKHLSRFWQKEWDGLRVQHGEPPGEVVLG